MDLSASAKLAVISIINTRVPLRIRPNLGFDLTLLSFYCKFCIFRILLFYIASFFSRLIFIFSAKL